MNDLIFNNSGRSSHSGVGISEINKPFNRVMLATTFALALSLSQGCSAGGDAKSDAPKPEAPDSNGGGEGSDSSGDDGSDSNGDGGTDSGADGGEDSGGTDGQGEIGANSPLIGSWSSKCVDLDEGTETPENKRESIASIVKFDEEGIIKVFAYRFEATSNCSGWDQDPTAATATPNFRYISRVTMSFKELGEAAEPLGAQMVDYQIKEIAMAGMTKGVVKYKLNKNGGFCGITTWKAPVDGKPQFQDISGLSGCEFDPDLDPITMLEKGDVIEDIYQVDGNQLEIGIDYDEDTLELKTERPKKFNGYTYTKK